MNRLKGSYAAREFAVNLAFSFFVISLLFSVEAVFRTADLLVNRAFEAAGLVRLFAVVYAAALPYVAPLAVLSAATALFTRLAADRELLVLASCGINPAVLLRRLACIAFAVACLMAWFNFEALPAARHRKRRLVRGLRFDDPLSLLKPGSSANEVPGVTILAGTVREGPGTRSLTNISISYLDGGGRVNYLQAAAGSAVYDRAANGIRFSLDNGVLLAMPPPGSATIRVLEFAGYDFLLPLPSWYRAETAERVSEMSLGRIRRAGAGLDGAMEIHRRAVLASTPLIFLFVGAGAGMRLRRKSRNVHLGVGILTGLVFFLLMMVGEIWSRAAGGPAPMWLPAAVFAAAGYGFWR